MPLKDPVKARAYRKARRAIERERDALRYAIDPAFRARKIASARKYYAKHRKKIAEDHLRWAAANRDKMRGYVRKSQRKARLAWCFDSELYKKGRAYNRMLKAKRTVLKGGLYVPRFACRIPDWATKGQKITDTASPWLIENLTDSQRGYARELAIERKERRGA